MAKKKKVLRGILSTLILTTIFVGTIVFLLTSNIFHVKNIEVNGLANIDKGKVISISLMKKGKNIFLQRYLKGGFLLSEEPQIKSAKIRMKLPDTIVIDIEENEKSYQISTEKGYYQITEEGYIINRSDERSKAIMLIGIDVELDGKRRLPDDKLEVLDEINRIRKELKFNNLLELTSSIEVTEKGYDIDLSTEEKKIIIDNITELRTQLIIAKGIIENEKGKKGIIYTDKNEKRQYTVFREEI